MDKQSRNLIGDIQIARRDTRIPAFIGNLHTDEVKYDSFRVYVTIHITGQVLKVRNQRSPNRLKWPVWVGYLPGSSLLQVLGSRDVYPDTSIPDIPEHNHTIGESDNPTWVRNEQILSGLPAPTGGMTVQLGGYWYYLDGFKVINTQDFDLTSYVPAGNARWVNVEVGTDGTIYYEAGSDADSRPLLTPAEIPVTAYNRRLLFSVKTYAGQTRIGNNPSDPDIFDPRFTGYGGEGGLAAAIDWGDILNTPSVFPPDLDITDPLYARKFLNFTAPTVNDDETLGYLVTDEWLDQSTSIIYKLYDATMGAADWRIEGGGGGAFGFVKDGALAVLDDIAPSILITGPANIHVWYFRLRKWGEPYGSNIFDIILNGVTSIFQDVYDDFRPVIEWDDVNGWVKVTTPLITDFVEGDILTLNVDQVADGADTLTVTTGGIFGGGSTPFNLTMEEEDGSPSVSNVGKIIVPNGTLQNNGGGSVTLKSPDYVLLHDERANGTEGGSAVANAWTTRIVNTEVQDVGGICSIASNQITLAAGVYDAHILCAFYGTNATQLRLYNITDSVMVPDMLGVTGHLNFGAHIPLSGRFTLTASKILEVQYMAQTAQADYGVGVSVKARVSNYTDVEVYSSFEFWRVA